MLIAQLSDTHIKPQGRLAYGRVDTHQMMRSALAHLARLPQKPDLLLLTGDLVDEGLPEEYERLRQLLDLCAVPMLLIPGNHDDRRHLRQAFPEQPGATAVAAAPGFWQFAVKEASWPLRIIGLDTVVPQRSHGLLCTERLDWLANVLDDEPDTPTLVMMHHPPFATGIGHMDDIGLEGRHALAKLLSGHPQVQLVVCGHLHRNIRASVGGRPVMTAPSTAHAVQLDLSRTAAAMFRMEPPGYLLHWWDGSGLVTHHVHAFDSEGPYPFFDDAGQLML